MTMISSMSVKPLIRRGSGGEVFTMVIQCFLCVQLRD
jgi:hypothetical protein